MASRRRTTKPPQYIPLNPSLPPREIAPPSPVPAARSIFTAANIQFEEGAEPAEPWRVVNRFLYWPLSGFWRSDDETHRGYRATELVSLIRRQAASPEGVAAVAAALDPLRAPPLQDHQQEQGPQ